MKKLISIIVPCYNVENYIDRCIQSLLCQTIGLQNIELILVNDASTDQTLDCLIKYENQYEDSIMVINLEENVKQGGARNIGIEYASADYIGFVDADDWIEPTMYEKLYNKMIDFNCDVVACDFVRDLGDGTAVVGSNGIEEKLVTIISEEDRKQLLLHGIKGGIWTKIYQKSFLINNNIFFLEGLSYEDNFFAGLIMYYINSYYVVEEYLYHYFVNFNSTILTRNSVHHFDRLKVELLKLEEYKNRDFFNNYYDEFEYKFLKLFFANTLHTLFVRFDNVPYNIYLFMCQAVVENFPNYSNNKYLTKMDTWWLNMIHTNISEKELKNISNQYIQSINNE